MKRLRCIIMLCCLLMASGIAKAQTTHWTCDERSYEFSMTLYVSVSLHQNRPADFDNYEVAAFVGDECRGVATVQSAEKDGVTYRWLSIRVRSNVESGEEISFRVYDKSQNKEITLAEKVSFEAMGIVGLPSSPKNLSISRFTPGDVNDDGAIDAYDLNLLINDILRKELPDSYVPAAADINNDAAVDAYDLNLLINIILKK